jgi:hypothetical protein
MQASQPTTTPCSQSLIFALPAAEVAFHPGDETRQADYKRLTAGQ